MKEPKNWSEVKASEEFKKIEKGAYPVVIKTAKVAEYDGFEKLEMAIDITDGEFKDYYQKQYDRQNTEDKKWKGVFKVYVPLDDGSEKDEWTKRAFKRFINILEECNPKFHWEWDEKKLKGLKFGLIFRNEEYDFNGFHGWTARPFKAITLEDLKNGNFKLPEDKPTTLYASSDPASPPKTATQPTDEFQTIASEDDLPF